MENLIWLVKSIKFPSVLLHEDRPVFQNELFSAHISHIDILPEGVLYPYLFKVDDAKPVLIETRLGKKISITPRLSSVGKNENLKILTLVDDGNELAGINVDHMESGRFVALGQLASSIAHEINNPLTVVLAKVHLVEKLLGSFVLEQAETGKKVQDALGKAKGSIVRISKVIKGMRSLARDGRLDDFQEVDVAALITETVELCQERIKENGIILDVNIADSFFVSARPYQIVQVLINLINNAIDALSGQAIGRILVKAYGIGPAVVIQVQDSGPGVKPGYESMVMEPFFTTKAAGVGTGLGLSISRQIIFSHNGKIRLNTEISNSCFEIELPLIERRVA
ncbi:MAG: GHKL domain-containing protein [Bdellovibrio sp.]|nr:GHKL domain-containing protein [Bdellovibrio sp.]